MPGMRLPRWRVIAVVALCILVAWRPAGATSAAVSNVMFNDTDGRGDYIGGVVMWSPPSDTSSFTDYQVFIANDESGYLQAALWYDDGASQGTTVSVGTNQFPLYANTQRSTMDAVYPALWMIVYTVNYGTLQAAADAAKLRIYDDSTDAVPPFYPTSVNFTDTDLDTSRIGGSVNWTLSPTEDTAFASEYKVYIGNQSSQQIALGSVPVGTHSFSIPQGTSCTAVDSLLVYASNPYGNAQQAASVYLGCSAALTTTTATQTVTVTVTSTATTQTVVTATSTTSVTTAVPAVQCSCQCFCVTSQQPLSDGELPPEDAFSIAHFALSFSLGMEYSGVADASLASTCAQEAPCLQHLPSSAMGVVNLNAQCTAERLWR